MMNRKLKKEEIGRIMEAIMLIREDVEMSFDYDNKWLRDILRRTNVIEEIIEGA